MRMNDGTIIGCVHEDAGADIGRNMDGERVIELSLHYRRGTAPVTSKTVLSIEAAIALRNHLDAVLDAGGIEAAGDANDDDAGLYGAEADELQRFAEAYAGLGDAVGEQVWVLLDGRTEDVNANAVHLIKERLGGMNRELDDAIEAFEDESD